ncbi:MAG: 16S rRNA (guanine(966)-N(2))-methyltransferase RsmD [Planctomycetota bacterium]|nr:MAG: 16S rRNA (guanine(966)-N(2))-methyltransferase RsmD [Planctomycetota bacterium]
MAKRGSKARRPRARGVPRGGSGRGLRIVGGALRGRRLETPRGNELLRPMRNQVREALFNSLGPLAGARTLDLFAGSGSLGLEALSRGAARAVFVDKEPRCLAVLERNVSALGLDGRAEVLRFDLARPLVELAAKGPFDLVLVHPPFALLRRAPAAGEPDVTRLLNALPRTPGLLAADARVAFETPRRCYPLPAPELHALVVERRKEYGSTALFIARAVVPPD